MRSIQDIAFGITGQTVYFDAPEGRPSSVTSVEVFHWDVADGGSAETAVGAGSVETSPNTTTNGAAGSDQTDPNRVQLTSYTGVSINRIYQIATAEDRSEWVEVVHIGSNHIHVRNPLHNVYPTGSTFKSTRIQATVDSTWVADETNIAGDDCGANPCYRVRWVYVVDGVTRVADTYFNLVRYVGAHGVRPQDIETISPGWMDSLPIDHRTDQGYRLIENAYREVKIDMHQVDVSASTVAESEVVDELVRYKTIELGEWARFLSGGSDETRANAAAKRYQTRLDSLVRIVARIPVRDNTGAATPIVAVGLTRR